MCAQTRNELRSIETMSQEVLSRIERGQSPTKTPASHCSAEINGKVVNTVDEQFSSPDRKGGENPNLALAEQAFWNYERTAQTSGGSLVVSDRAVEQTAQLPAFTFPALASSVEATGSKYARRKSVDSKQTEDAYFDFSGPASSAPTVHKFFPSRLAMGALMLVVAVISVLAGIIQGYIFSSGDVNAKPVRDQTSVSVDKIKREEHFTEKQTINSEERSKHGNSDSEEPGEPGQEDSDKPSSTVNHNAAGASGSEEPKEMITVDVEGNVKQPGLVHVSANARVKDAIDAAGGAAGKLGQINLARHLQDAEMIVVPQVGQTEGNLADVGGARTSSAGAGLASASLSGSHSQQISLNYSNTAELEKLPGVGPALAQRIVEYRLHNGGFKTVDELQKVSGIGPSKAQSLKRYVSL